MFLEKRSRLHYFIVAISVGVLESSSWQDIAGAEDFFAATVLLGEALLAIGELFISLIRVTRRVKPSWGAFLLASAIPGVVLPVGWVGSSPARMKPWPAPS